MRTLKYYRLKWKNILIGLLLLIPLPSLTYLWLSGRLALGSEQVGSQLAEWSNPGPLAFPVAVSVLCAIVGLLVLLYVILRCDIDEVLPYEE